MRALALASAFWLGLGAAAAGLAGEPADRLARLEALVADQPDDPELQWTLALGTLAAGQPQRAADRFAVFRSRWPGLRPDAARRLGIALYQAGRALKALAPLEEAVRRSEADADAQLFLGLTLLRLSRPTEADPYLIRAAELSPTLAPRIRLLRGSQRLGAGEDDAARELLGSVAEGAADDPTARVARRLLGSRAARSERRRLRLFARSGIEYDSNVSLEGDLDLPGAPSDRRDTRRVFGGGFSWDAFRGERLGLNLGYRFEQSEYDELEVFDFQTQQGFLGISWRLSEKSALRLDGSFDLNRLDHRRYLSVRRIAPSLLVSLGDAGVLLRVYGLGEELSYNREPFLSSLERDGRRIGGGFETVWKLPWRRGAWLSVGGRYLRYHTDASRDLFGLDSAFDSRRREARLRLGIPILWKLRFESTLIGAWERFDHRNVIDLLTDNGVGDLTPGRRRDTLLELRMALVRPLTRWADLEISVRGTRRRSSVDAYSYDRQVAGLFLRLHN